MPEAISILFGAAFTAIVCLALGKLLLRALRLPLYAQEEHALAFVTGSACLSLLVFALAALGLARPVVFLAVGALAIGVALLRGAHRPSGHPLAPAGAAFGVFWRALFGLLFALFGFVYFFNAMAPEVSPDGSAYHLGLVSRYLRAGGLYFISTNMYANLSQGGEMLFLFAFAFGKHSAAALVHFCFLLALPLLMLQYARRFRLPAAAGVTGALLVFLSPVAGYVGTSAYIDVAVACVLFALFYLLQIWDRERLPSCLVPIGLLAGFAYAVKYTAFLAVPYALGFVGWKLARRRESLLRPLALVACCALLMILPWVGRNWIWFGNPFSPFLNRLFPNPYVHVAFEEEYRWYMANWGDLKSRWEIPVEAAVLGGKLQGLLGPVFLLAPLALIALRWRAGRQLLLAAAVFGATYPANLGTRFLIPALPFFSLALGMVVANWKAVAPALVLFHALTAWPRNLPSYCDPMAMRLLGTPIAEALRTRSLDWFMNTRMPAHAVSLLVDEHVPAEARVFAFTAPPEAYTSREILVSYQAALNNNLGEMLWTAVTPAWQPNRRLAFHFDAQPLRRFRVVQTAGGSQEIWSVNELRVFHRQEELPREPQWRLRAHPNPWHVQWAFDNNPVTRWRSWERLRPGMYIEVDFGRPETIDRVVLECPPDHHSRLRLEAQSERGPWTTLSDSPHVTEFAPPAHLRRLATAELKAQEIEYLLIWDSDTVAEDMKEFAALWGLRLVARKLDARLYRID